MRVLFITNYPSPYRVHFFDALGKRMDVTVLFSDRAEEKKHRSAQWFEKGSGHFRAVQLEDRLSLPGGRYICRDVKKWLNRDYDHIIVCGYSSPTVIYAMACMRLKKIPFWMEVDGGLIREDSPAKYRLKRALVGSATRWLSTGEKTTDYLVHYGADRERVKKYPFSSVREQDLYSAPASAEEKLALRKELGICEEKMILAIGQFIPRKGFDILMQAAAQMKTPAGIYIVGGEPGPEYLKMKEELGLDGVHFAGFMKKEKLMQHYRAADLFVLPTREDIWGLVVNEAMACGLSVVTTDQCVAGLELVQNGINGYIVPVEDVSALADRLDAVFAGDPVAMGAAALETVEEYTIENMAKVHEDIFAGRR